MLCAAAEYRQTVQHRTTGQTCTMVIRRSRILKSALAAVNRRSFSYERSIVVEFAGQDGQDNGGP